MDLQVWLWAMQAMELNSHEDAERRDGRVLFSILAKFALF